MLCCLHPICGWCQAAEKAGKPFEWRVDLTESVAVAVGFPHLLATVEGCLHVDPNRRTPLYQLCDQLAAIRKDTTLSKMRAESSYSGAADDTPSALAGDSATPTPPMPASGNPLRRLVKCGRDAQF